MGKTELARALAEFLFDDERAMVRLDMSEYMEKFATSRLIGAPPGYVGYEEGGQLTEAIRRRPYAVVLLDEIEKAHPDVFHILLQVLDDGRLTDGQGRTVDFTNVVFIMTSNLLGDTDGVLSARVHQSDRRHHPISCAHRRGPLDHRRTFNSAGSRHRLAERRLVLDVTPAASALLAREGVDLAFGARPLKRVIQKRLEDPIALVLLEGVFRDGDTISVDVREGDLTFH